MKKKIYIIMFLLMGGLTSCNDWLDVKPETEQSLDEMFSAQQGFQDVLTGSYLKFKADRLYGKQMTYGNIEYLAQHWDWDAQTVSGELSRYNYKSKLAENVMSNIFGGLYGVVVELNMMLKHIDEDKSIFEKGMYEIIKGEALAMRAYCHLDLLRLFGPMPTNVSGKAILPYVKEATLDYHSHIPYQEYVDCLLNDLLEAEEMLKEYDPIISTNKVEGLSTSATDFLKDRQLRMNYYAVKALQARFYLWVGGAENMTKANTCAKEVIEAVNSRGKLQYTLGLPDDISKADFSFSSEHILAIHDYKLFDKANNDFTGSVTYKKDQTMVKSELFETGTTDIRLMLWNEQVSDNQSRSFTIRKYIQKDEKPKNQIPLIRLTEMYFIAMECGSLEEANNLYNEFCVQRDITPVTITNADQLKDILVNEYNKEFYGEGQMFYAYKRLAVQHILWALDEGTEECYVIPLPKKEVSYN